LFTAAVIWKQVTAVFIIIPSFQPQKEKDAMFTQYLFNQISRLIFSRWARDYKEYHGRCEDTWMARFGPLHLELNQGIVLDHDDTAVYLHIPMLWGRLHVGYMVCLGEDEIRQPGFHLHWWPRRLPALDNKTVQPANSDDDCPF